MKLNEIMKSILPDESNYIIGFANMKGLLNDEYKKYNHALVIGKKLNSEIIDSIENGPNMEYYNHYCEVNKKLEEMAFSISEDFTSMQISNTVVKPTIMDSGLDKRYSETLRTNFSHKMAATRAGLGWIGKTALFVSEKLGPRLRLATILLEFDSELNISPITKSKCGNCDICVKKCPAGAANGILWDTTVDRDIFFDAKKCREKCKELSKLNLDKSMSICGICVSVCPYGKK